ncbi:DUF2878 domain-containing protein [Pseudomonas sp. CNPSo 3701]|uniref:DUF2878 domain-containing protein n=1 Tax=Pseudomonas sp. CNPSo 3701 TaxID=3027943 RepID=UPI00236489E3|nr:DUF2878 domain-containing protein [Pseudomonas sp. CNPSo 3701]MDD1509579.1 DUF2878 domain-containing protein [Pseudomonas sp. CNPSo 3701]
MSRNLLNALLFLIGWLACLLGGGDWLWVVAVVLLVHLMRIGSWQREGKLLVSAFLFGSAVDSFLLQLGLFDFGEARQLIPLWQAFVWLLVGTTLYHCMAWTAAPWWRASLVGACFALLSYGASTWLGLLRLPFGEATTLALVALLWAIMLPLLHGFARLYAARPM